jgi:acyl transferase domain-containing protein
MLLFLSGNSPSAVKSLSEKYAEYLQAHPESVEAMAYTLAARRERLELASYCIAKGANLSTPPAAVPSARVVRTAFVFTGQGSYISIRASKLFRC